MSHQRVEAAAGWTWITRGWDIFMKNPGIWMVLALILGVIYFVLSFIPILGGLAASLLGPALFGGLIYGARELDHDRSLEIPHLFQAFQDSDRTVPMILLGLVPLAVGLVLGLLFAIVGIGVLGTTAFTGSESDLGDGAAASFSMMVLMGIIYWLISWSLLVFAIPRVMFGFVDAPQGVIESFGATFKNVSAVGILLLFLLVGSLIHVAVMQVSILFLLLFMLIYPVMAGAVYSANKQVFGGNDPTQEIPAATAAPGGAGQQEPGPRGETPPEGGSDEPPRD